MADTGMEGVKYGESLADRATKVAGKGPETYQLFELSGPAARQRINQENPTDPRRAQIEHGNMNNRWIRASGLIRGAIISYMDTHMRGAMPLAKDPYQDRMAHLRGDIGASLTEDGLNQLLDATIDSQGDDPAKKAQQRQIIEDARSLMSDVRRVTGEYKP